MVPGVAPELHSEGHPAWRGEGGVRGGAERARGGVRGGGGGGVCFREGHVAGWRG